MRLSTNMIYQQQTNGVLNAQSSWLEVGKQLSTGKRVINPSDDPISASNAVMLNQAQAQGSQYASARNFASQRISTEENTLKQVTNLVSDAQTILVAANNGTLSDDDRASYATQLKGLRDQILNQANSTDGNGRYVFAGYKSDSAPFTMDDNGNVTYRGGNTAISQQVDANRSVITNHTGAQVFMTLTSNAKKEPDGSEGESNIFATLKTAIDALDMPVAGDESATTDSQTALAKAMRGLGNSYNNILSVRSELGSSLTELSSLDSLGDDRSVIMQSQMSKLVDVDYTSAISSYTMLQAQLTASYSTFQQMAKMSLFQHN
ncbi:flagellar hook-filament junction protein FlgL [Erwinia sp. OLTSP20]|uniref:flagellar hook-associated protein FlgL n=1 Tax=unclassified Erwinia TaxID=2622719 RepID=UPI000C1778F3|nr:MULTISPECIES: flagellar hook-associated protein FlgL [unclassified Erwinia]PIJ51929.1 flagellar hook-filament junction protein FlgL [Erwinia sp. OAMSP11]PIJ74804.1 flagellar hook-filament junction protein FlgL [Erwinia sp. OLSSP12]PIJ85190.1 flagellar hook-filament junction protein FlgL [Erwinia sp. OLCASP19]PIJ87191.1 flagellar hook-filament junction protein FlgL [Erwinia sp. OLMTSP26]PIJ88335.1 flagellar hook-filament junction protein FlgL [Erwinia sp. OLMDSP33]